MHLQREWRGGVLVGLIFSLLLAGCGSGGEEAAPAVGSPVGVWVGSSSNGRNVFGAVMEDGSYTFINSLRTTRTLVGGATIGTYQVTPSGFTGSDLRDFSIDDVTRLDGSVTGSYQEGQSLNATMALNVGGGASVQLVPVNTTKDASDVALVAGLYSGKETGSAYLGSWIEVAVDGTLSFHGQMAFSGPFWLAGHCLDQTTGRLTPRQRGHVYDLTITDTCSSSGRVMTYRGVAIYLPEAKRLGFFAVDADRNVGVLYAGLKCPNLEAAMIGDCWGVLQD